MQAISCSPQIKQIAKDIHEIHTSVQIVEKLASDRHFVMQEELFNILSRHVTMLDIDRNITTKYFDSLLTPDIIETLPMAKVVLYNEFAKSINATLDDILFSIGMLNKLLLQFRDLLQGKIKPVRSAVSSLNQ